MIQLLHNLALFLVKNDNFFAEFFVENILKIITSVPGHPDREEDWAHSLINYFSHSVFSPQAHSFRQLIVCRRSSQREVYSIGLSVNSFNRLCDRLQAVRYELAIVKNASRARFDENFTFLPMTHVNLYHL
jgi:hypothetical protein